MARFLSFLSLCFISAIAQAESTLADQVAKQLRELPLVRANFVQTKQIAALKRPVVSRGRFVFSKERGILWEIQQPITLAYLLQTSGVTEIAADGRMRRQSGREAQGMSEVGRVLNALWSGNATVLEPLFQTSTQGRVEQWTLKLLPKSAPLSDFLTSIVVTGSAARIQRVQVVEAGNDVLTIEFQTEAQPVPLTAQEQQLFDKKP